MRVGARPLVRADWLIGVLNEIFDKQQAAVQFVLESSSEPHRRMPRSIAVLILVFWNLSCVLSLPVALSLSR